MAYFPTITYTNLKHKVADGLSSGDIKTKDEAITIVFNNGVGTTNKYKVSLISPFNQITGTLSSNRELTKWEARVTPAEVDDYGPTVGNRATIITGISANTNTNFTIPITQAVFTGSPTNTYRICLMGQSSLDYSWDCTQLYMVIDTNTSFTNTYTEVEYLESTGTQYINTGVDLGANNFNINCKFLNTEATGAEQAIFSIWTSTYNYWNCFIHSSRKIDVYLSTHVYGATVELGTIYELVLSHSGSNWLMSLNGSEITKSYTPSSTNQTTLKLFTRGDTPNTSYSNTHIKMYECKITLNGSLVRDFVPCIRNSDNKPGMYDRVNNVFYTNQGSGEFKYGPLKSVPQTYQQVDYIQSDGGQAINTGLKLDMDKAKVEITFQATTAAQTGMVIASSSGNYWWIYHYSSLIQCYLDGTEGGQQNLQGPARDTNLHTVVYQNKTYSVDNTTYGSATGTLGSTSNNVYMFKWSASDTSYPYKGKIYGCKIWNDGVNFTRNFIPCYRKSDNTIGMLDLVNNVFYTNAGSGTFIKGNNVSNHNYIKYKPTDYDGYDVHFVN